MDARRAVAVHEAGHAVVTSLLGLSVRRVTAQSDAEAANLGCCTFRTPLRPWESFVRETAPNNAEEWARAARGAALWPAHEARWRQLATRHVRSTLAGPLAQHRAGLATVEVDTSCAAEWDDAGWGSDRRAAVDLLCALETDDRIGEAFGCAVRETQALLAQPIIWRAVEAVASALARRAAVSGRAVRAIIRQRAGESNADA